MPIKFKSATKKSFSNYNRYKYVCSACDNEISFITHLPSKCSDCLTPIDDNAAELLKNKSKRIMTHLKLCFNTKD